MARYIDADEIRWCDHFDSDGNKTKYKVAYSDEMPPTIEAMPIIRCRDCKHYNATPINMGYCLGVWGLYVDENGYCYKAEP